MPNDGAHRDAGTLAARIAVAPQLSNAAIAHARVAAWLDEAVPAVAARLEQLFSEHPTVHSLIASIADASPYLQQILDFGGVPRQMSVAADKHQAVGTLLQAAAGGAPQQSAS